MAVSTSPMLAVPAAAGVARFRRAGSASTAAPCSAPRQQHVSRSHVVGAGAAVLDSPALREVSPSSEGAEHANEPRRYVSLKPASWTPLPVPTSLGEVVSALRSPELSAAVNDPSSLAYVAYQTLRTGFFTAATFATVALAGADPASRLARNGEAPVKERGLNDVTASVLSGTPAAAMGLARVLASQAELYRRELSFIKAGLYAAPYDADPRHRQWSLGFIADKARRQVRSTRTAVRLRSQPDGAVAMRRSVKDADVAERFAGDDADSIYPEYYLRNFHFQEDGWMSFRSARAYEFGTESLFQGGQDAMQRAALAPIGRYMAGKTASLQLLEVAAGTGRLHTFVKDSWPAMRTTLSELSPYYLSEARDNIEYFEEFVSSVKPGRATAPTAFVQAAAEKLPFADASFDILLNVYMFHEMPADARAAAAKEFARVIKPGGLVVVNDSMQVGDRKGMDGVFPLFPASYHEPYFMDYVNTDIGALFIDAGLEPVSVELAHVSKVWAFRKP